MLPEEFEPERACATSIGWRDPRTQPGELLWPAKIGTAEVEALKVKLGSYRYCGQYQQRPAPAGGGIFKRHWWRYWKPKYMDLKPIEVRLADGSLVNIPLIDLPDDFDTMLQSWDMSFNDLKASDYVVGGVWGARGADRFLLDQKRDRLGFPETLMAVKALSQKWPNSAAKLIEDKANGPAVIASLRDEIPGLVPINPEGGKIARAQAVSPYIEAGNVYLPHPAVAPWVEAFIEECAVFPNGRNDDQVDQMTQALRRIQIKPPQVEDGPQLYRARRPWNA